MIRVLVADDETLIRDAIATLLSLEPDIEITARAATGTQALNLARDTQPDIALLDLQLPAPDGIEITQHITTEMPQCRTLILTSHGRPGYLKAALNAGARGFLPKTVPPAQLVSVVRDIHAGGRYIDPTLAAEAIKAGDSPLTPREADVLALARDGAPIEEIARRVHLSRGTVRNYLASTITKLHVTNRHEAAHIAATHGWI